jgi:hypothetical protein
MPMAIGELPAARVDTAVEFVPMAMEAFVAPVPHADAFCPIATASAPPLA